MTLLNAPVFDERKEHLRKTLMVAVPVTIAVLTLITLAGFLLGHGWFFSNLPAEHKVGTFFQAIQDKDFDKAFGIYYNDPNWKQHPDQYKDYPESRFQEDWTTQDPIGGPLACYHVDISNTAGSRADGGTIVAVRVNGKKKVFMYLLRKSGLLVYPAPYDLQYTATLPGHC